MTEFHACMSTLASPINPIQNVAPADVSELESFLTCLSRLIDINDYLIEMESVSNGTNELFPNIDGDIRTPQNEELAGKMAHTDFSIFYGRHCGFHIIGDCRRAAYGLVLLLANFADLSEGSLAKRARRLSASLIGLRYAVDPDLVGAKVFRAVRKRQVDFCQSFYNLSEIDAFNGPFNGEGIAGFGRDTRIRSNVVFKIPPEKLTITNTKGERRKKRL